MEVIHTRTGGLLRDQPTIKISRGNDGFMLSVVLSPRRGSLLGPFPNAFQAERVGINMAEESGVERLTVVCDWLESGRRVGAPVATREAFN